MEQDLAGFGNKRGKMMGSGWVWAAMIIIIIWEWRLCPKGAKIKFFL